MAIATKVKEYMEARGVAFEVIIHEQTLPIRLSPTPTICSVHPFS